MDDALYDLLYIIKSFIDIGFKIAIMILAIKFIKIFKEGI